MNFYVQVIDQNGVPKRLIGPGTYEACEEKGKAIINEELEAEGCPPMTEDQENHWSLDGSIGFENFGVGAGGVYIVCSEEFS